MIYLRKTLAKFIDPYVVLTFIILTVKLHFLIKESSLDLFHGVFLINVVVILLILAPAYLFTAKPRRIYLLFCDLSLTFIILADLLYLRYFGGPISIMTIFQAANLSGLGPSISNLVRINDILYIVDFLILPLVFCDGRFKGQRKIGLFLRDALIAFVVIAFVVRFNYLDGRIFTRYSAKDTLRFWGPLGYHVMDTAYFIHDRNVELTPEIEAEILAWYEERETEEVVEVSPYQGIGEGKNLIIIQLESFQNFVVGLEIEGKEITPNLNKLLQNSIYFPHYYPQTIKGNSSDAELLSNTSLYPIKEGSTFFRYPYNKYEALPQLLADKGYRSIAIHGDEAPYWNRDKIYPRLGFAKYYSEEELDYTEEVGMGLSDEAMFEQAVTILKEQPQPFYAFIVTLTSHYPFWIPLNKVLVDLPPALSQSHLGNYLRSLSYTDYALGQFMQGLEEEGLLEDTIIAIYGDHDGLWERDKPELETLLAKESISEETWLREYVPVPLVIYNPGIEGKIIESYGGQIDFLPTIACLMGCDPKGYRYAMGSNLLAGEKEDVLIPGGDYIKQTTRISKNRMETELDPADMKVLDIADIIIRTDFLRHVKSH